MWNVHIIIDTNSTSEVATGVTSLKTFATGFPGIKPTVHDTVRNGDQSTYVKQWCVDNDAIYSRHFGAFKDMGSIYTEILRRSTQPTVVMNGECVFYQDMRGVTTTKWFKGFLVPAGEGQKSLVFPDYKVTSVSTYAPDLTFIKEPEKVWNKVQQLVSDFDGNYKLWEKTHVIRDGYIYEEPEGFTHPVWKTESESFSDDELTKYDTIKGGGKYTVVQKDLTDRGETALANTHMTYVNAAIAEDWPSIVGARTAMYLT